MLEIGKAAEYIVCAELILAGYRCFPSDQGLPYDLILESRGRLYRVQVKATSGRCTKAGLNSYSFSVMGTRGAKRLISEEADIMAFVALDCRKISFIPADRVENTSINLWPDGETRHRNRAWTIGMERLTIEAALENSDDFYAEAKRKPDLQPKYRKTGSPTGRPRQAVCKNGHPMTGDNVLHRTSYGRPSRTCRTCRNNWWKQRSAKKRTEEVRHPNP